MSDLLHLNLSNEPLVRPKHWEFLLSTNNAHKVLEMGALFDSEKVSLSAPPIHLDIEETGTTYHQNAYLKAFGCFEKFKRPSLADDSGLEVEALPNILGVDTANFQKHLPQIERCQSLINLLKHQSNRNACFVCVLCVVLSQDEIYFFEGRLKGQIVTEIPPGDHSKSFGYDPIFLPHNSPDGHVLSLCWDWKQKNSHRSIAVGHLQSFLVDSL